MAGDDCEVNVVLVDYRRDRKHVNDMVHYWQDRGLKHFTFYDIMNRGGALFVDDMQFEASPHVASAKTMMAAQGSHMLCAAPFVFIFIGYDGNYYLCCSDWKKEVPLGSVQDTSFTDVVRAKLERVTGRGNPCHTCNLDPLNGLIDGLRGRAAGAEIDVEGMHDTMVRNSETFIVALERLVPESTNDLPVATRARKRIPLLPA
jgi:Iron-sulfur cluster-binding domain